MRGEDAMNEVLRKLAGGNLRSDGRADEVADAVIRRPRLFPRLLEGLSEPDGLIRGRSAHAVERISRAHPEWVRKWIPALSELGARDPVPMVRWHMAMILGNLVYPESQAGKILSALLKMLEDDSVFVKSWALTELAILGRKYPRTRKKILRSVRPFSRDASVSVRGKASKVVRVLENDAEPIPAGWVKAAG
jgi:hypothetical protein